MSAGGGAAGEPAARPRRAVLVAAAVAILVGGVLLVVAQTAQTSYGWFAYAPLSDTVFTPGPGGSALPSAGLIALGLVVGAFWAGTLRGLGLRRRPRALLRRRAGLLALAVTAVLAGLALLVGPTLPLGLRQDVFYGSAFSGKPPTDFAFIAGATLSPTAVALLTVLAFVLLTVGLGTLALRAGRVTAGLGRNPDARRITERVTTSAVAAVLLLVAAVALVAWSHASADAPGWYPYSPVRGPAAGPAVPAFAEPQVDVGVVLVVAGLVILAFLRGAGSTTVRRVVVALVTTAVGIALIGAARHGLFVGGVPRTAPSGGDSVYTESSSFVIAINPEPQPLGNVALQAGVVLGALSVVWLGFVVGCLRRGLRGAF
ncbi:hypothetical protein [Frondihabitans peucedani]|uniref:hypothetical protein n=1 Tax=Frondihabitans peucedani TaxID=598626 RepID=UPI0031D0C05E